MSGTEPIPARLRAWRALRSLRAEWAAWLATPHPDPIFILGTQKSGTSAIAALLGARTGLPATIDLAREVRRPTVHEVALGRRSLASFVRRNAVDFARPIVKEPNLTFVADQLLARWPDARIAFVVRDPAQTIRSVLDRLGLRGDLPKLDEAALCSVPTGWRIVLDNRWLGVDADHYVDQLAGRWSIAARAASRLGARAHLIRYEDFLADKCGVIDRLAESLRLPLVADISGRLDDAFQPRGAWRGDPAAFFGPNLARIGRMCAPEAAPLGYHP